MRYLGLLTSICLISSCASSHSRGAADVHVAKLQPGHSVLIATPANGSFDSHDFLDSGRETASVVRSAFAHYAGNVAVSVNCSNLDCLRHTRSSHVDYYVVPEILHWEDRTTDWSAAKYKYEIKLSLYDANDGRNLATKVVSTQSIWPTFTDDVAENRLAKPVSKYVTSLF
jgi:hypothetical protein